MRIEKVRRRHVVRLRRCANRGYITTWNILKDGVPTKLGYVASRCCLECLFLQSFILDS